MVGIAQTSLAEILLKLNTGLVTIINTFLTRDKHDAKLDYQSLTNLSERSRDDTCRTLRQLFHRMTQSRVPSRLDGPRQKQDRPSNESAIYSRSRKAVSGHKHTRVKGPMLARVVIADSKDRHKSPWSGRATRGRSQAQAQARRRCSRACLSHCLNRQLERQHQE